MLIVDTGVLVAAADTSDRRHDDSVAVLDTDPGPFVTTAMVIAETAYLVDRQLGPGAEAALYRDILNGDLRVEGLGRHDWERILDLVVTYADLPLGGTDASVITVAERLGATRIATLDDRHFRVIRPSHCDAFDLVP